MTWGEGDVWKVRLQCYDEGLEMETECKGAACGYGYKGGDEGEAYVGVIVS